MPQDHPDGTIPMIFTKADVKMPVDIQAQLLTLDINIKAQDAKVAITINATDITGQIPIDIKAATAKVSIKINATDITGNLPIDIKTQTLGQVNVNIKAQTLSQLNVNIAASAATVTVSVTGTANISITAQSVGVYLKPDWETKEGNDKNFQVVAPVGGMSFADTEYIAYEVPGGKTLYICGISFLIRAHDAADYDHFLYGEVYLWDFSVGVTPVHLGGLGGGGLPLSKPMKVAAGDFFRLTIRSFANVTVDMIGSAFGYEI